MMKDIVGEERLLLLEPLPYIAYLPSRRAETHHALISMDSSHLKERMSG
jgi:hypothetical protein